MRFVCDSCRAQYMISDDKVGPKGAKVRCKKCGHSILVRKAASPPPAPPPASFDPEATQVMQNPLGTEVASMGLGEEGADSPTRIQSASDSQKLFGALDDEIGAVFDTVLSSGQQKAPGEGPGGDSSELEATRVMDALSVSALAESHSSASSVAAGDPGDHDWYVAIDEKQSGPFKLEKIKSLWDEGQIGPDNLCWRAGLSDWLPLSDLSELASMLAPQPKRPVIVAQATSVAAPSAAAPVESAFSAGGFGRSSVTSAPASGEESAAWKPSAASALASLAQEEMSALNRPARPVQPVEPQGLGLLDLPAEAPASPAMAPSAPLPSHYAPPAFTPPSSTGHRTLLAIGGAALVLLLVLVGVVVWAVTRQPVAPTVVAQAPVQAPVVAQVPAPAVAPAAVPTAAAPSAAPTDPTASAESAKAEAPKPEVAKAEPAKALPPAREEPPAELARQTGSSDRGRERRERFASSFSKKERESSSGSNASSGKEKADSEPPGTDDEFDKMFGGGGGGKKKQVAEVPPPSEEKGKKGTVYIPPAPGAGADLPERLGQSDIMQVVLANRSNIKHCVDEQKKKSPDLSGKLVMRWTIQTSGKTSGVSCRSDEFKSTYMASCVSGLIKAWQFPKHRVQGDPIDFPFTF